MRLNIGSLTDNKENVKRHLILKGTDRVLILSEDSVVPNDRTCCSQIRITSCYLLLVSRYDRAIRSAGREKKQKHKTKTNKQQPGYISEKLQQWEFGGIYSLQPASEVSCACQLTSREFLGW